MPFTGGPLNELNGKMGISAPENSVPVMKLISIHKPKSKSELVDLIKWHSENECKCGIKSKGTIESFGKNLFEAQQLFWGEVKFSLKQCIQWEYDLFIVQSLKGGKIEKNALIALNGMINKFKCIDAIGKLDEELRIDLLVTFKNEVICGIQVKPDSFLNMRKEVVTFNKDANKKWGKPVYYLYYNEQEKFVNLNEVIEGIKSASVKA